MGPFLAAVPDAGSPSDRVLIFNRVPGAALNDMNRTQRRNPAMTQT